MSDLHIALALKAVSDAQANNLSTFSHALQARMLNALPLAPVQHAASFLLRNLVLRHGDIFARLRGLGDAGFLIDVTDLPVRFVLHPGTVKTTIAILRREDEPPVVHATISGNLATLLSLLQGKADGDALFFTRALSIHADMAAVLCLRNALDGAEIDLVDDFADRFGPVAMLARQVLRFHARMKMVAGQKLSRLQAALPGFRNAVDALALGAKAPANNLLHLTEGGQTTSGAYRKAWR